MGLLRGLSVPWGFAFRLGVGLGGLGLRLLL
jgi:hypothetical protein